MARGVGAAQRTLDSEDRSGTWRRRESGRGSQGVSHWRGSGACVREDLMYLLVERNQLG